MTVPTLTWEQVNGLKQITAPDMLAVWDPSRPTTPFFNIADSAGAFQSMSGLGLNLYALLDRNNGLIDLHNLSDGAGNAVVGPGLIQVSKVALGALDTAGGILAWQAPVACFFRELLTDITTKSTGACTGDFGFAANGTTLNDTLLDGINLGAAAAVFSSRDATNGGDTAAYTDAVLTFKKMAAGDWITGSKASGSAAGLVGNAYILWIPV